MGGKQFRPWLSSKKKSKTPRIDEWLLSLYPEINDEELSVLKSQFTKQTWKKFIEESGISDSDAKVLVEEWKKMPA